MTQISTSPVTGGQPSPASSSSSKPVSSGALYTQSPSFKGMMADNLQRRTRQLVEWHTVGDMQVELNKARKAEYAFDTYGTHLGKIAREVVTKQPSATSRSTLSDLTDAIKADKVLDLNMNALNSKNAQRVQFEGLSILESKDADEMIAVALPNGQQTSFKLFAGATTQQNLSQVKRALSHTTLDISESNGQVFFAGPQNLLGSPWMIQGEDVRVSSQPSEVAFRPEPSLADRLDSSLGEGNTDESRKIIKTMLNNLEHQALDNTRNIDLLNTKARKLGLMSSPDKAKMEENAANVIRALNSGDVFGQIQALSAQANLSHELVFSLSTS